MDAKNALRTAESYSERVWRYRWWMDGPIVGSSTARSGRIMLRSFEVVEDELGWKATAKGVAVKANGVPYDQRLQDYADQDVINALVSAWREERQDVEP